MSALSRFPFDCYVSSEQTLSKKYYSANQMKLCVLGTKKDGLERLEAIYNLQELVIVAFEARCRLVIIIDIQRLM